MKEQLLKELQSVFAITDQTAQEYYNAKEELIADVNRQMSSRPDIGPLIGGFQHLDVMYSNHFNHAMFMYNVYLLGAPEMITHYIDWVYASYNAHGFTFDYFREALEAWRKAVRNNLSGQSAEAASRVYGWMIDNHEKFALMARGRKPEPSQTDQQWADTKSRFTDMLIEGDRAACKDYTLKNITSIEEFPEFFVKVLQPSMYDIGTNWETGKISVAVEHMATAIAGRISSTIFSELKKERKSKGRIMISCASNEYHELGAWALADMLELEGWDVRYLGANVPFESNMELAAEWKPDIIGVSVSIPTNLHRAMGLIKGASKVPQLGQTRFLAGGSMFGGLTDLWKKLGAHGSAADARGAVRIAGDLIEA